MAKRSLFRNAGWVVAVLLAAVGCGPTGPQIVPVSGTVTLDGEPVAKAAVLFMPQPSGPPASGVTDKDGKFTLMTGDGQGAVLGEHLVTVTLKETTGIVASPDGLSGEIAPGGIKENWLVPERYSRPDTSNLKITVTEKMPGVELKLLKAP